MRLPENADRDFVAGAFIVEDGEILFLNHKKLDFWLMPGGHVEDGETPDETAVRETREETGLDIEIIGEEREFEDFSAVDIPRPFNVNLHRIKDGHWHCDFQYVARVNGKNGDYEYSDDDMRWLSIEEIESGEYDIPANVRKAAEKAIEQVDNK